MPSLAGFTVLPYGDAALGNFRIGATGVVLSLRRELAPLLVGLALDFHHTVEPLHPGWCWGHSPRTIAGTDVWSRHAIGAAIDLNAPAHPMGRRDTFTPGERQAIRTLLGKYRHAGVPLFRWGGDYTGRPDDMHFECIAPRATLLAAVKALQARPPAAPAKPPASKPPAKAAPTYAPGRRTLRDSRPPMSGPDVAFVQRFIGPRQAGPVDSVYGPRTIAGVRWYQRMRGIASDGIVGPRTWAQMGVR